jgi:hypothetical protein
MQRPHVQHVITAAVAAICVVLAMAHGGFGPTAFSVAGLAVWIAVLVGLAIGVLPRSEIPGAAVGTGLALAGLAGMMALSIAWASDDGDAFGDVVRALAYLGAFVLVVLASRRGEARPWLAGLAIGLVAIGAIALLGRFVPGPFGDPDADLARTLPAALGRLTYPIGYWNGLAAVMSAAIVLCSWFASAAAGPRARALAVGALPPVLLALWMTDSRGGLVAAGLAFVILLLAGRARARMVANLALGTIVAAILIAIAEAFGTILNDPQSAGGQGTAMLVITLALVAVTVAIRLALDERLQRFEVSRDLGRVVIVGAIVAVIVAVIAIDPIEQYDEFKAAPTGQEPGAGPVGLLRGGGSGRYQFWETAVNAFESAPVGGVGASGYTPYWFEHRDIPIPAQRAHSVLFETLAELGIVGLALLVAFFGAAVVAGVRRARAPAGIAEAAPALALLAVGLAAAAVDWTWDLPAVFVPTVAAAALLTGPATLAGPDPGPPPRGAVRTRRRFAAGVGLLLVAWVSICACGLLMLSANALHSSRDAAADGDIDSALSSANDAVDLQPWAADPRTQLALVYEQAGDYDKAVEAINEAISRSPDDYRLRLLAARMKYEAGDRTGAYAALLDAQRLNPRDPDIQAEVKRAS